MSEYQDFFEQFHRRKYLQSPFNKIETIDIVPSSGIQQLLPVLFAPGWRETPELQRECLFEVYKFHRRVLTLLHSTLLMEEKKVEQFPQIELQKAKTLLALLEYKGVEKVDVITHSEGAINVAIAATLEPHRFRNLVLVTPAGLMGKDSIPRIAIGFGQHIINSRSFLSLAKAQNGPQKRVRGSLLQNLRTALQEGLAITSTDIHPLLLRLKEDGIKIAVLVGEKDTALPYRRVVEHLSKTASPPNYGFDIFATRNGGHELYSAPHEVMPMVLELLNKLND